MCLVVTCWERADLLALVCDVQLRVCHFPIGLLGQVLYLIVSIPDLCTLTYLDFLCKGSKDFSMLFMFKKGHPKRCKIRKCNGLLCNQGHTYRPTLCE